MNEVSDLGFSWGFLGSYFFSWNENFIAGKPLNAKSCENSGICQKWTQNFLLRKSEENQWQSSWLLGTAGKHSLLMGTGKNACIYIEKNCLKKNNRTSSFSGLPSLYIRENFWAKENPHRSNQRCSPASSTCGNSLGSPLTWHVCLVSTQPGRLHPHP